MSIPFDPGPACHPSGEPFRNVFPRPDPDEDRPSAAGEFLYHMLGPVLRPGPPYVHTLRLPETEEEMAAAPSTPQFSVSAEDQAEPQ